MTMYLVVQTVEGCGLLPLATINIIQMTTGWVRPP